MDNKNICLRWKEEYNKKNGNIIINPITKRQNKITTKSFTKIIQECKKYDVNIIKNDDNDVKNPKISHNINIDNSQYLSEEFSNIKQNFIDYDITDAIHAFMIQSNKDKNDNENVKREFLLTKLHLKLSEVYNGLSEYEIKYLKNLEKEWYKIIKEIFNVDIYTDNFDIVRRSKTRNYYYDLRIQYEKNGKKYGKRIDIKIDENYNEPPQFQEKHIANVEMFKTYLDFFYDNYIDILINNYNRIFSESLQKPKKEDYVKYASSQQCDKSGISKDFFIMIKSKSKNNKEFKIILDDISKQSITKYITNIQNMELEWLIKILQTKMHVHYLTWSRKNKIFFYTNYTDNIKDIIQSIKNKKITIDNNGKYPKIIITPTEKKNDKYIEIRLHWSNGNGVCNPSVKISWKTNKKRERVHITI